MTTSGVRVTFAGSGDAFGSGGRLQSCVHLRAGSGDQLLLDCGSTALVGLNRHGIEPNDVGAVAVSHLHGDHYGGLPYLVLDGQFRGRTRPLDVVGPAGLREHLVRAMELLFPGSTRVERRFAVRVQEIAAGDTIKTGAWQVRGYPARHHPGANALSLRVEGNDRTVAYSGDTEWSNTLLDTARGADLFICEGYTVTRQVPFHLHVPRLRRHLDELSCRRLILTHPSSDALDHRRGSDQEWADDDTALDI